MLTEDFISSWQSPHRLMYSKCLNSKWLPLTFHLHLDNYHPQAVLIKEMEVIFIISLNRWFSEFRRQTFGGSWHPSKGLRGQIHMKTLFAFHSSSHKYTVEFSNNYLIYDSITDWMRKQIKETCKNIFSLNLVLKNVIFNKNVI